MVIKDFYCVQCENIVSDVQCLSSQSALVMLCNKCRDETPHESCCHGGLKSRYRFNDFNRDELRKLVTVGGVGAECEGKPVYDNNTGEVYQNRKKYDAESLAEKKEIIDHGYRRKEGKTPIYLTPR